MFDKIKLWIKQRAGVEDGPVFELGKLPPGIGGMCVWPIGIFIKKNTLKNKTCLKLHEQFHWDTQRKTLGLWYVAYFVLLPFYGGGRKHPLEKPAYAVEDACVGQFKEMPSSQD